MKRSIVDLNKTSELTRELLDDPEAVVRLIGKKVSICCSYVNDTPAIDTPAFFLKQSRDTVTFIGSVRSARRSSCNVLTINFGHRLGDEIQFIDFLQLSLDASGNLKWETYLNVPYAAGSSGYWVAPKVSFHD